MATTHTLAGVLLGLAALAVAPVESGLVVLAGAVGGLVPDLDLLGAHRRTLHFPGWGTLAAVGATGVAVVAPTLETVAAATFLWAFALHAVADVVGGGLSLRPWNPSSDRGVYEHVRGRWHPPRRWIRYDGAPEDAFLAVSMGLVAYASLDGTGRTAVVGLLVVSVVYAGTRRALVDGGQALVDRLPPWLVRVLPEALVGDFR
ncbi:metal-dependent hydrolase [Halobaculum sp. MBLA0147]|uniref:metal-dependent hydrolase n=1 Tax=Halobaculum sp. MBLA0147 TaxID=3079934 RepID=UPI0035267645